MFVVFLYCLLGFSISRFLPIFGDSFLFIYRKRVSYLLFLAVVEKGFFDCFLPIRLLVR